MHSSSDSDVDIEETASTEAGGTTAWIQQQRKFPEPFLTAPEILSARRETGADRLCSAPQPASATSFPSSPRYTSASSLGAVRLLAPAGAQPASLSELPDRLLEH